MPSSAWTRRSTPAPAARWPRPWSPTCSTRCAASERIDKVIVVTGENGAEALARAYDAESIADDDRGHSHAARAGVDWALERDYDRVLLVPGDCPALDPREVDELVARRHERARRRHRPRPPRHRHQRAAARAARRHRARASARAAASATSRRPPPAARAGAWPSRARSCSTSTPPTTSRSCAPRSTRAPAARRTRADCWRGWTATPLDP